MSTAQSTAEVLWDRWGVPHVYADDEPGVFRGFGWAQMRDHGDLVLRLYGRARGRAAEYWGEDELAYDRLTWTFGFPDRAAEWYSAQTPAMRANLDAFAAGMNAWAEEHADELSEESRRALPVRADDAIAHTIRVLYHFFELTGKRFVPLEHPGLAVIPGSNAWAIGPAKSSSGAAILLANPHLSWSDLYTFYEAHLVGPDLDAYGCTLIGWPMLAIAFNDRAGWTHTVNFIDGWDAYRLTPAPDGDGYLFDGEVRQFDVRDVTLRVRQADGTPRAETLTVRRSVHGPVLTEEDGCPIAVRTIGVDATQVPGIFEQYLAMARAGSVAELETAMRRMQSPMFTAVAADSAGHVMHLFGGHVPRRASGDFAYWSATVPGDSSANLWTDIHDYDDLPKVVDPPTGWVQNANCPPWTATWPPAIDPDDYPEYMSGRYLSFRERGSLRMLIESEKLALEDVIRLKHSTRMELASRIVPALTAAARDLGSERARRAATVLDTWDGRADPESRGAALFQSWIEVIAPDGNITPALSAGAFQDTDPLGGTIELANPATAVDALDAAAGALEEAGLALDIPWGDLNRYRIGDVDLPGHGSAGDPNGTFRNMRFLPDDDGRNRAVGGDTFVLAVEFSDPVRAYAVLGYGNSSRNGIVCDGGQLPLLSRGELREVIRDRNRIDHEKTARAVV